MNKKGFTLVELLAVMAILSILALITTPVVINIINQSKHQAEERQQELIEGAAERWGVNNLNLLPTTKNSTSICVCVKTLVDKGYLSKDTKDITKDKTFKGRVEISYDYDTAKNIDYHQQKYTYKDNCLASCKEGK